jgi:hypothetical protein
MESPPSSAEVKNAWSYTSIPQHVFMEWCLVKHRGNFTFNSMEQSPSSASHDIPGLSWKPKVCYSLSQEPATGPCPKETPSLV